MSKDSYTNRLHVLLNLRTLVHKIPFKICIWLSTDLPRWASFTSCRLVFEEELLLLPWWVSDSAICTASLWKLIAGQSKASTIALQVGAATPSLPWSHAARVSVRHCPTSFRFCNFIDSRVYWRSPRARPRSIQKGVASFSSALTSKRDAIPNVLMKKYYFFLDHYIHSLIPRLPSHA